MAGERREAMAIKTNRWRLGRWLVLGAVLTLKPAGGAADDDLDRLPLDNGAHCSSTAFVVLDACKEGARSDRLIAFGKCLNIEDEARRDACVAEARISFQEAMHLCREQKKT